MTGALRCESNEIRCPTRCHHVTRTYVMPRQPHTPSHLLLTYAPAAGQDHIRLYKTWPPTPRPNHALISPKDTHVLCTLPTSGAVLDHVHLYKTCPPPPPPPRKKKKKNYIKCTSSTSGASSDHAPSRLNNKTYTTCSLSEAVYSHIRQRQKSNPPPPRFPYRKTCAYFLSTSGAVHDKWPFDKTPASTNPYTPPGKEEDAHARALRLQ